jgi:hypothetical protein
MEADRDTAQPRELGGGCDIDWTGGSADEEGLIDAAGKW